MKEQFEFEIVETIGVASNNGKWSLELNRVSWNGRQPVFDLRKWNEDHTRMTKGISFTEEEAEELCEIFNNYFEEEEE